MKPLHVLLLAVMNVLWAASYSMFKVLAPYLTSGQSATWRYLIAGLVMAALWPCWPGRAPAGRDLVKTMVMGVIVFALGMRFQVAAAHLGKAGDVSLLMAVDPLITAVAASIFLGERVTPNRWGGLALGMLGVVFMAEVWRPGYQMANLAFSALILANFVCETAYSIIGKPLLARAGLFKVVTIAFLSASAVNVLWELSESGPALVTSVARLPWSGWMFILYLALVCSVLGYSLWYWVIRETEVSVTVLSVFFQPIAGLIIAMIWLGEQPRWSQLWGSLAIVLGLAFGLKRPPRS